MATNSAGIRITQAGISVPYAADYQFVFNSDWPSLAVAFDGVLTVAGGSTGSISHNLGFYPLTMAWFSQSGVSMGRFFADTSFDKNTVYIDNSANSGAVNVNVKCYNVDIQQHADYFLPSPPILKTPYDPSTGIKVSKYQKSIASTDLRDFILHSRAQSPAILTIMTEKQGTISGSTNVIHYDNPAHYTPWTLGFIAPHTTPTRYKCFPPGGNQAAPAFFQIGASSTVWTDGTTGKGSLVVLRDPLVIPETLRVVY